MKVRYAKEIGTRIYLRRYWGEGVHGQKHGYHNAMRKLIDIPDLVDFNHHGGSPEDYPDKMWPAVCEVCGEMVPDFAKRQVHNKRLYDTPTGKLGPGDAYIAHWLPLDTFFDNQTKPIFYVICPDGWEWSPDSRASNCTMKDDRLHRCWVTHGSLQLNTLHVDKNGLTCQAGAGSILTGKTPPWHGFLHNGHLVP